MSEFPMRGHFRYLRFKTFPMTPRTPQCEVFCLLLSSSEHSGVPEDSQPPTFPSVGLHPHTWPKWGCDTRYDFFMQVNSHVSLSMCFFCEPLLYFIFNNDVLQLYNKNLQLVYALNPKPFGTWFFCVFFQFNMSHVLQPSFAKSMSNYIVIILVVIWCLVMSFSCFRGGHHNHVGWLKFMFLKVFKVHRGLRLGFQVS
jgi:hypothetical protein